ncbi:MAG: HIT domain-containing protein [Dehalococcoidia bacterium]
MPPPEVSDDGCLFCRIAAGGTSATLLHEDDLVVAIDIPDSHPNKRAPVHFIVIPRRHIRDALELTEADAPLAGRLFTVVGALARQLGVAESGFRLLTNTGPDGNQTEFHFHLHCIGGRALGPEAEWVDRPA